MTGSPGEASAGTIVITSRHPARRSLPEGRRDRALANRQAVHRRLDRRGHRHPRDHGGLARRRRPDRRPCALRKGRSLAISSGAGYGADASLNALKIVIPAKAGISNREAGCWPHETPAFAGVTVYGDHESAASKHPPLTSAQIRLTAAAIPARLARRVSSETAGGLRPLISRRDGEMDFVPARIGVPVCCSRRRPSPSLDTARARLAVAWF